MNKDNMKIFFSASKAPEAQRAFQIFTRHYGQAASAVEAKVIVSIGGDGQATRDLLTGIESGTPVFGINYGHLGHLLNAPKGIKGLEERIYEAEEVELSPLCIEAEFLNGDTRTDFAINEALICNNNRGEGIYLRVLIDDKVRIAKLGGDGIMISTTLGSTGYSKAAHGSILPLGDDLLSLTPNNAYMPDGIRPAVIRPRPIQVDVIDAEYRQTDVYADSRKLGEAALKVCIHLDTDNKFQLLFDPGYGLEEKVMRTQFPTSGLS